MTRVIALLSAVVPILGVGVWAGAATAQQNADTTAMRTDGMTAADILESRVLTNLAARAWGGGDFRVEATERGGVTLSGTVPSERRNSACGALRGAPSV